MHASSSSALAADLTSARFTVDALDELWGHEAASALFRGQRLPAQRVLADRSGRGENLDSLGTLATLFVLGLPVPVEQLAAALPMAGVDGAIALGLVDPITADGCARPLLDLRPYAFTDQRGAGSWWIASDLGEMALGHAIPPTHVLGIGGASTTLSGLMITEPVTDVLDLGTGCGIQALHASRHALHVVATDISERAIELARLNAELNGVTNIEFRLGSLFDPVAGERFDQIVSNPPFVITPRIVGVPTYEYRDGGLIGDGIVAAVLRGASEHLQPGGIAQFLGNWEYRGGQDGLERVSDWIDRVDSAGSSLDAWVIEREKQDAATYAETWIRDGGTRPGTPEFDSMYAAWLDDFEARGVDSVGFGYVTLRRRRVLPRGHSDALKLTSREHSASGWRRLERVETSAAGRAGLGEHIEACLAAAEWLGARDDHALAQAALVVAADVTEERHYWPGADDPSVIALHQGGGFGRSIPVGSGLAAVVGACDGDLTVGAICSAVAQLLEVDDAALLRELLPQLRELVATGFLSVSEGPMPA
ncbi:MAG TPA: methyltransferase [Microbacteriaceae bacterium]|nr:methyltransferase [Microbacteriaceae bacterium]